MDGVFVPNLSVGTPVIKVIKRYAKKPMDVHLMIIDPGRYISHFKDLGADILTVHYEACTHLHGTIQQIKEQGMKAGVSLNPHTPVKLLEEVLSDLDLVLIMSVNPGFGGQSFIPGTLEKIRKLDELKKKHRLNFEIEVDGGVTLDNAESLVRAGVTVLVAGNTVFSSDDPVGTIKKLKELK